MNLAMWDILGSVMEEMASATTKVKYDPMKSQHPFRDAILGRKRYLRGAFSFGGLPSRTGAKWIDED